LTHFGCHLLIVVGRMSIGLLVKFLAVQKMICYEFSYSVFKNYFQMGQSTARLCVGNLTHGIVKCPPILDLYLRCPKPKMVGKGVW
jgi:hypothetical protein